MKLHTNEVDIRVAISTEHDLIVNLIPRPGTFCQPKCEYVAIDTIPGDVMAYIELIERKRREPK